MKNLLEEIHNEKMYEILGETEMTNYKNYLEENKSKNVDFISYLKRTTHYERSSKCRHFTHEIKKRMLEESQRSFEESRISEIVADCTQETFNNTIGRLYRLCWLAEIDDKDKKSIMGKSIVNLIFRLFFDITRFDWNGYLYILGGLMSLRDIKEMIKTQRIESSVRRPRKKNAETRTNTEHSKKKTESEIFCAALIRNISSKLDLVLEDEWKGLFEMIDPLMESFEQILDYADCLESDTRDDIKAFFKDLISIIREYGVCFRKGEIRELFEVIKKIRDRKMINSEDLKSICRIYFVIDTLEKFKNHFYRTRGCIGSYVNIVNTEKRLASILE